MAGVNWGLGDSVFDLLLRCGFRSRYSRLTDMFSFYNDLLFLETFQVSRICVDVLLLFM